MKTKNLIYILGLFFIGVSCNDAIEIDQPGRLSADAAFQNVDDLEAGLFAVYNNVDLTPEIAFATTFTDEISIGFDNGGQGLVLYSFTLNAASTASANFWVRNYAAINSATRLIEAAEIVDAAGEQSREDDIIAQAYALRAYFHFQLLSYYSTDLTDDSALGVIRVDFVPTIDQQLLRNTNGEVFDLIMSDLAIAEADLQTESDVFFLSQDAINAMRARIALYRGQYAQAGDLAEDLLNDYPIANQSQYFSMFLDEDNTEIIWKLQRTIGDSYDGQGVTGSVAAGGWAGAIYAFVGPGVSGSPYYEMGRAVFNMLDMDDIRYDVNVHPSSIIDPNYPDADGFRSDDILVIDKYPGSEGQPLMNDLKVFRSSEMLFILAEARADAGQLNGPNSAASLIDDLRDARFGSDQPMPTYANQQEAFGDILDERRIELAFEGHRYKDLKRVGTRGNRGVRKDPLDCAFNGACTLPADNFRFTLPLPIVEFQGNPGLRAQQNPGY